MKKKKTRRVKRQCPLRTPATAPPELPLEAQENKHTTASLTKRPETPEKDCARKPIVQDAKNDSNVAPLARDCEKASLAWDTLCERCFWIQWDMSLETFTYKVVELSSLDPVCKYCQQFLNVLKLVDRSNKQPIDVTHFTLCRQRIHTRFYGDDDESYYMRFQLGSTEIDLYPLIRRGLITHAVGKRIKPNSPNFDMFKAVLNDCCANHTSTCEPSPPQPSLLRFIDCRSRQIIPASHHQPYVCLSYVWGQYADEIPTLQGVLPDSVPKTVEDAMFVAIQFGIPFLWVDRYCIDQKKPQEKHNIVRNMDKIYHGAELTIIAIAGEGPHHGLPGVRGIPRKLQYELELGEDIYVAAEQVRAEINDSKWATRAWTYQEMLLSRRKLVFTDTQMYFQCMNGTSIESLTPLLRSGLHSSRVTCSAWAIDVDHLYGVFPRDTNRYDDDPNHINHRLCEYYKRQLSFCSDTIDAFLGVLNFYRTLMPVHRKITQFYGILFSYSKHRQSELPRVSFLEGLLWLIKYPDDGDEVLSYRDTPYVVPHTFPSWSWASVKASQSVDGLGELMPNPISNWPFDCKRYRGIEVRVQHRHEGIRQVVDLRYDKDDYKNFMPWIDITTWTRTCKVLHSSLRVGVVSPYCSDSTIHDPVALQKMEVHAICLKATSSFYSNRTIFVSGLLVVETEPGVYRRVASFSWRIESHFCSLTDEFEEELQHAFDCDDGSESGEAHMWKRLAGDGWNGPQVLERLREDTWQRRTMRLI